MSAPMGDFHAVPVRVPSDAGAALDIGQPQRLLEVDLFDFVAPYDVTADGQRFPFIERAPEPPPAPLVVVRGWEMAEG